MKLFQKLFNRAKQEDGSYKLSSFWTAAETVEFDDEENLEECKNNVTETLSKKGDGLLFDKNTKMLYLLSGENKISGVEISNAGGSGEVLGDVSNVSLTPTETTVTIKWTDPNDGEYIQWGGTTVIRKKGSRPVDCLDGEVVVDSTTKNQYQTNGFVDSELDKNTAYWYRFFPYTTEGQIRTGLSVVVTTLKDDTVIEEFPTLSGTYVYNGNLHEVTINEFDSEKMVVTSGGVGTDAGNYDCVISLKSGFHWPDNSSDPLHLPWTIEKANLSQIPSQNGTVTYTGTTREPSWLNYNSSQLTMSGTTSGVDAGLYTVTFTPTSNYQWSDGSVTGRDVQWEIQKATISTIPSQNGTVAYTGSTVSPTWSNYDSNKMTFGGQTSGVEAGTYIAVFTPTINYKWSDDTTGGKEVSWVIEKQGIATVPSQSGSLTYNGNAQSPTWNNYDATKLNISGNSGTNAGTYTATFTPKTGYQWSDGTTSGKSATWVIGRQTISIVPSVSSSLTYSGSSQSPTWNNYDSSKMTIGGTYSATNAGTYTATFTPKSNYQWSDGSTTAKSVSWTINKKTGTLTLSKSSTTVNVGNTDTITASGYKGTLSVTTSNSSIATAIVSGSTITVTGVAAGSAYITVTSAATNNYYSVSKNISVTVNVATKSWKQSTLPDIPVTVSYGGSRMIVYNNEIHVLGVGPDNNKHYKIKPGDSNWTLVSTLPQIFSKGMAIVYNNEIHIMGGIKLFSGSSPTTIMYDYHYKYNGSSWVSVSTLPRKLANAGIVVYNNEIHLLGGSTSDTQMSSKTHYKWNGSSWTQLADMNRYFGYGGASVYNNNIYTIGGFPASGNQYSCYCSKWNGTSWSSVTDLPTDYSGDSCESVIYENKIHAISDDGEIYKLNNNIWEKVYKETGHSITTTTPIIYNNKIYATNARENILVYD